MTATADRYVNPILDADWPDPDAIRVGSDYYLVTSSFNRVPGLPVLHSRNLVDWAVVARALPALPQAEHYGRPRHGCGVWAPAIRHRNGTFYIVYPDPDFGFYVLTADDPRGPWSEPKELLAGRGLIDPCPLWDDDGRAYLVHGWAKSRSGISNRLTVAEITPDLSRVIGEPRVVIDGDDLPGYRTLEGPKFYRRDGWYWIFAPAGGVAQGWQSVFRSKDVYGPYEERIVLEQGDTEINGPHQGAWVDTPDGADWFLHFQDRGPFGRVVHLQPMGWEPDGWPRMGRTGDGSGPGRPVTSSIRPGGEPGPTTPLGDAFPAGRPGLQWYWQANPDPAWLAQAEPGRLSLTAVAGDGGDLRELAQVLAQPLPGGTAEFETELRGHDLPPGGRAGVVVLGQTYAWLGLRREAGRLRLVRAELTGATEDVLTDLPLPAAVDSVTLHLSVDADAGIRFGIDVDGIRTDLPDVFQATAGRWIGAELGLFAAAPPGAPEGAAAGAADFGPVALRAGGA